MFDCGYERWHTLSFEDLHHMLVEDGWSPKHVKLFNDWKWDKWNALYFKDLHHMLVEDKVPWTHRIILQSQEMRTWILWLWRCWGWDLHAWENYSYSSNPYINSPSLIAPDLLWFSDFKVFPCFPWPASKMGLVEPLEGIMCKVISLCFSCTFGRKT